MPLSLKQVRYFVATADFGQISQAAKELNVSQSTVTAAVRQLEQDIGVELFVRRPTGVSLTAEGARFLQQARNIMAAVSEAIHTPLTREKDLSGHIKLGLTYTVAGYFMPRYHARFSASYPDLKLEMIEQPRATIEDNLEKGNIDIAVMLVSNLLDHEHLAYETMLRSRRRLWLPGDHPLLEAERVTLEDVAREPYIVLTVDEASQTAERYWQRVGLEPNAIFKTSSVEAVRSMVAAGMGVTILSDMVYRPWSLEGQRIETRSIDADIPTMDVGLAWARSRKRSPAVTAFADFMSHSFSSAGPDLNIQ